MVARVARRAELAAELRKLVLDQLALLAHDLALVGQERPLVGDDRCAATSRFRSQAEQHDRRTRPGVR